MAKTIMVVDAEKRTRSLMESCLRLQGYQVCAASNGPEALRRAQLESPDMIILSAASLSCEERKGFLRALQRAHPNSILLLMTSTHDEEAPGKLEMEVSGYLSNSFRPRELMACIRTAFRRAGQEELPLPILEHAGIVLDNASRSVKIGSRYVDLTPSEFDLLAALMSAPGRVVSRADLLDLLQGACNAGNPRVVDLHIKNLRAKIEVDPRCPRYIETVYGFGYRFAREIAAPEGQPA